MFRLERALWVAASTPRGWHARGRRCELFALSMCPLAMEGATIDRHGGPGEANLLLCSTVQLRSVV